MHITELVWSEEAVLHIQKKHNVEPEEVEEICFSEIPPLVEVGRGGAPLYYVLGQSSSGRCLFVVARYLFRGKAKVITARDMDSAERKRYHRKR